MLTAMPRRALPWSVLTAALATALAACERDAPALAPAGPAYSPANADLLKALAAQCDFKTTPTGEETRTCRGPQTTMRIEITPSRRIRELDIEIVSKTGVWEAWTLYENVLPGLVPEPVVDAVRKRLRGDPADTLVAGARIAAAAEGERYKVKLTWGP